jgi:hypothetical protein
MSKLTDFVGAMEDYVGDDDMLGAPARALVRRRRVYAPMRRPPVVEAATRSLAGAKAGVPKVGPKIEPLGFPVFTFNLTSGTTLVQVTRPQKRFKGSRLVLDIARTGATALQLVTMVDLKVGAVPVPVNSNPIGAGAFAANAQSVEMMLPEAIPGIEIALTLGIVGGAFTGSDRIDVSGTIIGMTFGDTSA